MVVDVSFLTSLKTINLVPQLEIMFFVCLFLDNLPRDRNVHWWGHSSDSRADELVWFEAELPFRFLNLGFKKMAFICY